MKLTIKLPWRRKACRRSGKEVWIVNQYAMTPDLPGINRHYELGAELQRHGWHATIFATALHHTTGALQRGVSHRRWRVTEQHSGVTFNWLYSTPYRKNNWRRYFNMLSFTGTLLLVTSSMRRPEVIIGSSPHLLAPFGAWMVAARTGTPFLLEVRDVWPDMLVQLGLTNPLIIKPLSWIERFLYARADRVIALTDGIKDRIVAKGVPAEKIVVIPNSLMPAPALNPVLRAERRAELGWQDKVVAVWAGSHNPMNGLDVVVEAARLLQDRPEILIAFIGDGSLKADLIAQAKGLPNVRFYDPVPKTEIGEFLRAADIGLLHSRKFDAFEGARPNKLFEYMGAGLAIVSTVPGEAWRLLQDAEAGTDAPWENPLALADAIAALAAEPANRAKMGANGFAYVRREHNREHHVAALAQLLNDVAQPRQSPTARRFAPDDERPSTSVLATDSL